MISELVPVKVKEIAEIYSGNSINEKVKVTRYTGLNSGIDYISTKDISFDSTINYSNGVKIPYEEVKNFKRAPKDTVFICAEGGSAGRKIGISDRELCFVNKLFAVVARNSVLPKYLYYYFKSEEFIEQFKGSMTGIIGGVSINKFKELYVKLPALDAQQKIVAKLDAIFAEIDKATAAVEANAKNAEVLFQSYLNDTFENIGKEWKTIQVSRLGRVQSGGTPSISKKEYWDGDIDWYSSGELNNLYTLPAQRRVTVDGIKNSNAKIFPENSLLIGMYDTAAMKMSLLSKPAAFNQAIVGIEPSEKINMTFLYYAFSYIKPYVLTLRRGVRQKNLSLAKIKDLEIKFPSLDIQNTYSKKLNHFCEITTSLKSTYINKICEYKLLKQSLLDKAFNGGFTKE